MTWHSLNALAQVGQPKWRSAACHDCTPPHSSLPRFTPYSHRCLLGDIQHMTLIQPHCYRLLEHSLPLPQILILQNHPNRFRAKHSALSCWPDTRPLKSAHLHYTRASLAALIRTYGTAIGKDFSAAVYSRRPLTPLGSGRRACDEVHVVTRSLALPQIPFSVFTKFGLHCSTT